MHSLLLRFLLLFLFVLLLLATDILTLFGSFVSCFSRSSDRCRCSNVLFSGRIDEKNQRIVEILEELKQQPQIDKGLDVGLKMVAPDLNHGSHVYEPVWRDEEIAERVRKD